MPLVISDRFDAIGGGAREPVNDGHGSPCLAATLAVTLNDRLNDDLEFPFMVNHLKCGSHQNRRRQAEGLCKWAARQELPIIAAGD